MVSLVAGLPPTVYIPNQLTKVKHFLFGARCPPIMPSDSERFQFLAEHQLSITWNDGSASIFWRGKARPGEPGAYYPLATAKSLAAAVDSVIERYDRKHGKTLSQREPGEPVVRSRPEP